MRSLRSIKRYRHRLLALIGLRSHYRGCFSEDYSPLYFRPFMPRFSLLRLLAIESMLLAINNPWASIIVITTRCKTKSKTINFPTLGVI